MLVTFPEHVPSGEPVFLVFSGSRQRHEITTGRHSPTSLYATIPGSCLSLNLPPSSLSLSLSLSFFLSLSPPPLSLFLSLLPLSLPQTLLIYYVCCPTSLTHLVHGVYKNHVYSCMHVHACMGALAYLSTCKHKQV